MMAMTDEQESRYHEAVIAEVRARAGMYDAAYDLLRSWDAIVGTVGAKIAQAALEEITKKQQ